MEEFDKNGICWIYDRENGKLTISGQGPMQDYYFDMADWRGDIPIGNGITDVIIMPGITHIGSYSFFDFDQLENIYIPHTVETIGRDPFSYGGKTLFIHISGNTERLNGNWPKFEKIQDDWDKNL